MPPRWQIVEIEIEVRSGSIGYAFASIAPSVIGDPIRRREQHMASVRTVEPSHGGVGGSFVAEGVMGDLGPTFCFADYVCNKSSINYGDETLAGDIDQNHENVMHIN